MTIKKINKDSKNIKIIISQHFYSVYIDWKNWLLNQKNFSTNTVCAYEKDFKYFLNFLTKHFEDNKLEFSVIEKLTIKDFRSWLSFLSMKKNKLSPKSMVRARASVKSFINYCILFEKIKKSEITKLATPKLQKNIPRPLTELQILKIIEFINKERDNFKKFRNIALIYILWGTGLRISEALSLDIEDMKNNILKIEGKGNKERLIPMLDEVMLVLQKWINFRNSLPKIKTNAVFVNNRGKRLSQRYVQKIISKLRKEFNLDNTFTPHSFRHSFASHLLKQGVDLRTLQMLLGHSNITTTQHYMKVTNSYAEKVFNKSHPRAKL